MGVLYTHHTGHHPVPRTMLRGMRCLLLPVLAVALLVGPATAQTPDTDVLDVVHRLFDGMRTADTTMMRSTFHPDVRLVTTGTRAGEPTASVVPIDAWLDGVAGAEQVLDERLYDTEVRVHGGLASVWTYYTLHVGDDFSHCGYDAFDLVRTPDGWRIIHIADTRQREDCRHTERDP